MKAALGLVLFVVTLTAVAVGLALWVSTAMDHQHQRTCSALGAHAVNVGGSHFLCVSPDGRVVGP